MLGWLFPVKCVFCGSTLPTNAALGVCGACETEIPFYESAYLYWDADPHKGQAGLHKGQAGPHKGQADPHKGQAGPHKDQAGPHKGQIEGAQSASGGRRRCDRVVCSLRYEGIVSSALMRYKFFNRPEFGKTLAALLCEKIARVEGAAPFDCVACVPLSQSREKERGYNQAGIIARHAANFFGCHFDGSLLRRDASAMRQSRLSGCERTANARSAYTMGPDRANAVTGLRVLLIDDIATTLSTINACAGALSAAGAMSVVGGVIAARV